MDGSGSGRFSYANPRYEHRGDLCAHGELAVNLLNRPMRDPWRHGTVLRKCAVDGSAARSFYCAPIGNVFIQIPIALLVRPTSIRS